jgi:hypothetical protein
MTPLKPEQYTLSNQAIVVLGHLREHYSLNELAAEDAYKVVDLPIIIDELVKAGHVIYEIPRPTRSPRTYTLFEFKDNEPKLFKLLTKTKERLFCSDVAA